MPLNKLAVITALALAAFAANSLIGRAALGTGSIDAASFTAIRLLSGAFVLFILVNFISRESKSNESGGRAGAIMLFLYAIFFSLAYISLDTGTGALILFGAVQITMILGALYGGEKLSIMMWSGLLAAFGGFVNLVLPGVTAPSITGFLLMSFSGVAWGLYTLMGRESQHPTLDTAHNFIGTIPYVFLLLIISAAIFPDQLSLTTRGIILAVISGSLTSALGYVLWYQAVGHLSAARAGVIQLLVPVLAAGAGILFLSELLTTRFVFSAVLIIGGIALVIGKREKS